MSKKGLTKLKFLTKKSGVDSNTYDVTSHMTKSNVSVELVSVCIFFLVLIFSYFTGEGGSRKLFPVFFFYILFLVLLYGYTEENAEEKF